MKVKKKGGITDNQLEYLRSSTRKMNKGPAVKLDWEDSDPESIDGKGKTSKQTTTNQVYQELMDSKDFLLSFQPKNIMNEDDTSGTDDAQSGDELVHSVVKLGLINR